MEQGHDFANVAKGKGSQTFFFATRTDLLECITGRRPAGTKPGGKRSTLGSGPLGIKTRKSV